MRALDVAAASGSIEVVQELLQCGEMDLGGIQVALLMCMHDSLVLWVIPCLPLKPYTPEHAGMCL